MLNELHIENIAVIEKADISFSNGFNVLTGETGAGKSIIIDSIGAILGERTSKELIRAGADNGVVTAVFDTAGVEQWLADNDFNAEDELIIQRKISKDGKSSCRISGIPATVTQLRELGGLLIDIHGQNDGRKLMDERSHLGYLDSFGGLYPELQKYGELYNNYKDIQRKLSGLQLDDEEKSRLCDILKFRVAELEAAQLTAGEEAEITERLDLLRNSEKLTENIEVMSKLLYEGEDNAGTLIQNALFYANKSAALSHEFSDVSESLKQAEFLVSNASEIIKDFVERLDFSPEEYNRLETRLSQISRLERKYHCDEGGLLDILDESRKKLDEIEYSDDMIDRLKRQLTEQAKLCREFAGNISKKRREAAEKLKTEILSELRDLSMPSVRFDVEITGIDDKEGFNSTGCDIVRFVMSANAGEQVGRISKIASGGELSRIMLSMKNVFSRTDPVQTLIFDEIDTGVSGIAARRVGEKLFEVSKEHQVMCVTHLPQIAALADSHYTVSKDERGGRTYTHVSNLDFEGRAAELARLYGGDVVSEITLRSAAEQLKSSEEYKKKFLN